MHTPQYFKKMERIFQQLEGEKLIIQDFHNAHIDNIIRKAVSDWSEKLKTYLLNNLKQFGYHFQNDTDFFDFCQSRIRRITFEENRNKYEFYLDFVDDKNKGTLIGGYSNEEKGFEVNRKEFSFIVITTFTDITKALRKKTKMTTMKKT